MIKVEERLRNMNNKILCIRCGRPAYEHCYSESGRREVGISGICEECFDELFAEDEIDEEEAEELLNEEDEDLLDDDGDDLLNDEV